GGTMPDVAKLYLISRKVEGFAEGTLYNYEKGLYNFFKAVQKSPQEVTSVDVRVYLYKYQEERGVTNRSLDKQRSYLSSFFKWAEVEGYIEKNPMSGIKQIKWDAKEKAPCTQVDLEYLRMACDNPKHRAILELFYSSGCRIAELANLKISDIDFKNGTVLLFGKGKKYRTSFLNAKAEVALKEYLAARVDDSDALFVSDRRPYKPMQVDGIRRIIRLMEEATKDNLSVHVTPHIFRHTLATTMIENGADVTSVQQVLGHSNINTTMIYAHKSLAHAKADHRKAVV
ncbi:MAG: tyrosine-type recombinase/integrase, partial [Lachnospiraceae bacterium]|nr:tyrosine-type recombinase/integrase [Lachnospiraceae bacterium]